MVNIRRGYGVASPRIGIFPKPVNAQRAPTANDTGYPIGQLWVDNTAGGGVFILQRISGTATWINMGGAGGMFDNLTVNPGPTTLTGVFTTAGGAASINASSNFNTVINSGTSTGTVTIGNGAAGLITIDSGAAGVLISSSGLINIDSSSAGAGNDIIIEASDATGGVAIRAGNSITINDDDSTALVDIGNVTPSVNRDLRLGGGTVITAVTDTIIVGDGGVSTNAGATKVINIGVGNVLLGTQTINIGTGTAASGVHDINIGTGTGGGTKSINMGNADNLTAFTLDASSVNIGATAASNFTVTGALDLTLDSTAGSVIVDGGEAVADAVQITASNAGGGVTIAGGSLGISLDATAGTIDLNSTTGLTIMTALTDTQASPTATAVINANVGAATFTGFVTAAGAAQVFTITNSVVSATSEIFCTAANEGANDAQMTITRINRGAGTFNVTLTNNGAAALNGNVTITFWVIG